MVLGLGDGNPDLMQRVRLFGLSAALHEGQFPEVLANVIRMNTLNAMNSRLTVAIHITGMIAWIERELHRSATSSELAESAGGHDVFVRGILADLGRAGIVVSRRGRGGGTSLARPAQEITLAQIYSAIRDGEGPLLGAHPNGVGQDCRAAPIIEQYLSGVYAEAEAVLTANLSSRTVDEMSRYVVSHLRHQYPQKT